MSVKYQIFVSSTYEDLKEERQAVINVILQLGHIPVSMEFFSASDEDQWTIIRRLLDDCDYYIVIVAGVYGSIEEKSGKSYTQLEYEYALEKGIPVLGFLRREIKAMERKKREKNRERVAKLEAFSKLVGNRMCDFWITPHELSSKTAVSLIKLMQENPQAGWIRACPAKVDNNGTSIPKTDIVTPLKTSISIYSINEDQIVDFFQSSLSSFASFIELYYLIEGLYSHSDVQNTLPNAYLIPIRQNAVPAHLQQVNELWLRAYKSIHNFINVKEVCGDRPGLRSYSAAATIHVSYIYFCISELWGDVPYIDKKMDISAMVNIERQSQNDIKEKSANNLLEILKEKTTDTQYSDLALGLLTKWELRTKNHTKAKGYLDRIINSSNYQLAEKDKVFNTKQEAIFSFDTSSQQNVFNHTDFIRLCKKGRYVHCMRYTELLLMASEINYHLSRTEDARFLLNKVKDRNKRSTIDLNDNFIPSLLDEWKADLSMEGSYLSALKRNDLAQKRLDIPGFKLLLPLPMQEIIRNPRLTQNTGY